MSIDSIYGHKTTRRVVIYISFLLSFSQTRTWNSKLPTMNAYMTSLKILSPISNRCLVRKWTVSIYRCRIIKLLPTFLITSRFFFLRVVVLDPSLTKILLNKNENIEVLPWDRLFERCLYIFVFALWVVVSPVCMFSRYAIILVYTVVTEWRFKESFTIFDGSSKKGVCHTAIRASARIRWFLIKLFSVHDKKSMSVCTVNSWLIKIISLLFRRRFYQQN